MLCRDPFMVGTIPCACSRCPPCRINRKRLWKSRILLESMCHGDNAFVTLTYADEKLPPGSSLLPSELQGFLKRLRSRIYPAKFRFFAAGEYGEKTFRPHYHVALFGFGTCLRGRSDHLLSYCCSRCSLVQEAWPFGGVDLGELNEHSAGYIAKYVVKGWTKEGHESLKGRHPEFVRMSLRPGIGAMAMDVFAGRIKETGTKRYVLESGDVPHTLVRQMSGLPIGRYLRGRLRKELSVGVDGKAPVSVVKAYWQEMRKLRREAEMDPERKARTFKEYVVEKNTQKWLNLAAKVHLRDNKGVL